MSFSHPQRPAYGALRHSRSSSTLTGLNQARHTRNCFQRRPLRTSHSTQCLYPSVAEETKDEEDGAEDDVTQPVFAAVTTTTYMRCEEVSGSDSEYSEYDLVNEQMQGFLLDSDDSCHREEGEHDVLAVETYCVSGFMPSEPVEAHHSFLRRGTAAPQRRRRLAKKAESSASLASAPRMTPSSSTALLCDLDTNRRDGVAGLSHSQLRQRKPRRTVAGDRRWLLPALAPLFDDSTGHRSLLPLFTVVFDLDETLVGARYGPIQLRPHIGELLHALHTMPVEVVVWTAGTAHYVNPILHAIGQACGRRQWFHHIISRHKRWYTGANTSVKDLSQLGRPMERVLMIENNPISVVQQPGSCILVEDYLQANPADESLRVLQGVLERLTAAHREGATAASSTDSGRGQAHSGWADDDPLSAVHGPSVPSLAQLLSQDAALRTVEFNVEDVCNEDGVSMHQKVELRERVAGAKTLVCRALRYTPPLRTTQPSVPAAVSVAVRSYGCVNPLLSL